MYNTNAGLQKYSAKNEILNVKAQEMVPFAFERLRQELYELSKLFMDFRQFVPLKWKETCDCLTNIQEMFIICPYNTDCFRL